MVIRDNLHKSFLNQKEGFKKKQKKKKKENPCNKEGHSTVPGSRLNITHHLNMGGGNTLCFVQYK